jgi:ABC-type transporter Mla MlaB component
VHKAVLLNALAECRELDLDLSGVGEMDTAGFQLLLLAKREAANAGKTLRIGAHSKAVTELLDLYNMAGYFGDPLVIPAKEQIKSAKKGS